MPDSPTSPNDFAPESTPPESSNNLIPVILLGALGCGGLILVGVGILAAIALPSFLTQADRVREAEARNYAGAMLRGQQAYHIEYGRFSASIEDLTLGLPYETHNYAYQVTVQPNGTSVTVTATPKVDTLRSFAGAVYVSGDESSTVTTQAQLCESTSPTLTPPSAPTLVNSTPPKLACPPGTTAVD